MRDVDGIGDETGVIDEHAREGSESDEIPSGRLG